MKTTTLTLITFFLSIGINANAQWSEIGVNLPLQPQSTTPSIQYSDYSDRLYLLSHDLLDSSICSLDTIGLYGSNWGVFDASISAIDFTAEENGNLTFVRLDANNYVELFSIDENGLTLWTETAIGLPPINGAIYDIDVFQGINNEYYVSVYSFGVEDVYKFESSTWSSMGFLNHDGRFDSSGRFTRFNMVEVTTPGLESRTYNFEYFDGVNWIQFESVTFSGLDGLLTKYTIDSNNKIYAMMDIPYAGGPFSIHQLELYTIQLGIATQLGNTLVVSFTSSAGNHAILLDRRENPQKS